ncbi:cache domain-containing protein [Fundidesulfovibrio soli]|uniref:cache domain-containing protein n=1 Tax=Fundidesulfovibrio soli TaxID=2922716 RepID=UPI001FAEC65A|nr:cache domain-containing protein [Fundidesulfovibrio soli]
MLRRFSISVRLFGLVGLVLLSAVGTLVVLGLASTHLENMMVRHTQTTLLESEKIKIKALTHSMSLALANAMADIPDEAKRRRLARKAVEPVRFEDDASGYFFIYHGTTNVALPPRPELVGRDLNDFVDRNGVYYVRELARQAEAGGGYVNYVFTKPDGVLEEKVSYAEPIPGTDLWIGTGVYLDRVNREMRSIANVVTELFEKVLGAAAGATVLMMALLCLACLAIAHSVVRPLAEVTEAAERIAGGDLDTRLSAGGRDEATRMQAALNRMTQILRRNISEIEARRQEAEDKANLAQQALREARRAGDEVVVQVARRIESLQKISSSVAHQLRNPTTIIGGLAGLLLKKPTLRERYLDYLDGIVEAARRIEHITAAVKEYSAIRLGRLTPTAGADLLDKARTAAEALAQAMNKQVEWTVEDDGSVVQADAGLLALALREVAINAVEALDKDEGQIVMSSRREEEWLVFTVQDNGRGITPEDMLFVLDPFHSTKPVGVGMGLTKAQRILQEHGGSISVESEPGKGTTVRMRMRTDLRELPLPSGEPVAI